MISDKDQTPADLQDNELESDDSLEIESKSQRKREAHQITALAGKLVTMKPKILSALPIDPPVLEAIRHCAGIKAHGARKRQLHYVSKLLRNAENIQELQNLVDNPELKIAKTKVNPHKTFRDELLLHFNEKIEDLREQYPSVDLQQVRHLVRNAHKESAPVAPDTEPKVKLEKTKASKSLLRLLVESQ